MPAQPAEQLSLATVPIVAVPLLGAGAGEVGLLATAQTLPFLLLAIPLGLVADRVSRRTVMVWAELLRSAALLGMLLAVLSGQVSMALLAVLGFLGAVGTVGFSVAAPALVPALVSANQLGRRVVVLGRAHAALHRRARTGDRGSPTPAAGVT